MTVEKQIAVPVRRHFDEVGGSVRKLPGVGSETCLRTAAFDIWVVLVTWNRQKSVLFAGNREAKARDLSTIVDTLRRQQVQRRERRAWNESVEIGHHAVLPDVGTG